MAEDWEIFKIQTRHNHIEFRRFKNRVELRSGNGALQSVVDLEQPQRLALKNLEYLLGVLLFVPPPRQILLLGTAAGSLLHYLRHNYPDSEITALDIDAELIEKLLQMDLLPPAGNGLTYVYDDAAHYIAHCPLQYDLVLVDIFSGAQSPAWLLEKSTQLGLRGLLHRQGAVAYNLIIDSETGFNRFYRDLRLAFARHTLCLPVAGLENIIAFAFADSVPERSMDWYRQRALQLGNAQQLDYLEILAVIYNTNPVGGGVL